MLVSRLSTRRLKNVVPPNDPLSPAIPALRVALNVAKSWSWIAGRPGIICDSGLLPRLASEKRSTFRAPPWASAPACVMTRCAAATASACRVAASAMPLASRRSLPPANSAYNPVGSLTWPGVPPGRVRYDPICVAVLVCPPGPERAPATA
jgi:hypothetical protein